MKKLFLAALVLFLAAACNNKQTQYTISGECDADSVYFFTNSANGLERVVPVVDGKYFIKGKVKCNEIACITDNRNFRAAGLQLNFYLEPGDIVVTQIGEGQYIAKGSPANDAYMGLAETEYRMNAELQAAFAQGNFGILDSMQVEYKRILKEYVNDNMSNYSGFFVLMSNRAEFEDEEIVSLLDNCPEDIKQSEEWLRFKAKIENAISIKTDGYKDFAQASLDRGQTISLKSVVETEGNKYVLLDFWASWCTPCMGEVPHLIEAYKQYHDSGFEIYGCSFDKDENAWKAAIESNGMNWIQVSELKAWDNSAAKIYGIESIPANLLIDCSTGLIVASNLRGQALIEKLNELMK